EAVWLVVGAYSIAQAAIVALGRFPLGMFYATRPDYMLHSVYLPASVAALFLVRRRGRGREWRAFVVLLAAIAWAAPLLGDGFRSDLERRRQERRHARACVLLHRLYFEANCVQGVRSPGSIARRIGAAASMLRPAPVERLEFGAPGRGAIERIEPMGDEVRVEGWASLRGPQADAVVLTVADDPERIVAIAVLAPPDRTETRAPAERGRWQARVEGAVARDPCRLRAHVFDGTRATLHPLAGLQACAAGDGG